MQHRYTASSWFWLALLISLLGLKALGQDKPQSYTQAPPQPPLLPKPFKLPPLDSARQANRPNARLLDSLERLAQAAEEARLMDPTLKRVPTERLESTIKQINTTKTTGANVGIPGLTWAERGPSNVAVKIRTFLTDPNDPTGKKVWAGSEVGGLWFTPDITSASASWSVVSDAWENRTVSALAADPGNTQVMYAGTGEMVVSPYAQSGGGIWKTTNGGTSWQRLSSTIPSSANGLQSAFYGISKIVVNSAGTLFVATRSGVIRSSDGGNSWQFVLAPQQSIGASPVSNGEDIMSDLEIGSDGTLFAATRMGRLFRSGNAAGTSWTEVTPPNTAPYNGNRTELALAPSTSGSGQVLYAVSTFYNNTNYDQDVEWFLKSTDAGNTWTVVPRPAHPFGSSGNQSFMYGGGWRSLTLAVHPTDAQNVYVGGYYYLFNSTDGAQTWSSPLYCDLLTAFSMRTTGIIFSTSYYGIAYSQLSLTSNAYYTNRRNKGFNTLHANSAALRNVPGSNSVLTIPENDLNLFDLTQPGVSDGSYASWVTGKHTFIDQDQSGIQLGLSYWGNSITYRVNTTSPYWSSFSLPGNSFVYNPAADYDSRNNTLYTWNYGYYKVTDIGNTNVISSWSGLSVAQPSAMRSGAQENTLYVATYAYNGVSNRPQLYRVVNANTNSPGVQRIDGDAFPIGSTINHIEVGVTDNQLIVVLSNYGVKSVWYSANVGASWISKDEPGHGLPDVPVHGALFNSNDNNQVMLATEAGVWTTTNINDANPGWELGNTGMPVVRVTHLRARRTDGRVVASTYGRGVWETNVWQVPHTPVTLTVAPLSSTGLCVYSYVPVSFTLNNATSSQYVVYLSDSTGSFASRTQIGSGSSSPISVYIPYVDGAVGSYRIRVEVADLGVSATLGQTFRISNLTNRWIRILDRRNYYDTYTRSASWPSYICSGQTAVLRAGYDNEGTPYNANATFIWALNGSVVSGQTSMTLPATQAGTYSYTVNDGACSVGSTGYSLNVGLYSTPYVINGATSTGPLCAGTNMVIGASTLSESGTYQWFRDGVAITGATTYSLAATQTGAYSYSVSEATCSPSQSTSSAMAFGSAIYPAPILISGGGVPVLCGNNNSLFIYSSSYQPYKTTYQWLKDGQPVVNATTYGLSVSSPGEYAVRYQQGACSAISTPMAVSVSTSYPVTITYSGSTTMCTGATKYLYPSTYNYSMQWMRDGVDIPGATNSSYAATASGAYAVRLLTSTCSSTALSVPLTFTNQIRPELRLNSEYCSGSYLIDAEYQTISPNQYYWYRNGALVYSGSDNYYYYATQAGTYSFSATYGSSCTGRSTEYAFVPGTVSTPIIRAVGANSCPGSAVGLSYSGSNSINYWKRNGTLIPGSQNLYSIYATESGLYTAVYQYGSCIAESDPVAVNIGAPIAGTLTGNSVVPAGRPGTLVVGLTGASPWSFSLSNGQVFQNITENPYSFTLAPTTTTSYSLAAVRSYCGPGTATGTARISIGSGNADVSIYSAVSTRTPRVGEVVSYSITLTNNGPDNAQGVQLTDRLPAGLTFVDGSPGWTVGPDGTLSLNVGALPNGETRLVYFRAQVNAGGMFVNATEVSDSQTPDPDSQPNTGTADGQDDASQTDIRTSDIVGPLVASANPNAQLLPNVRVNQPTPVADKADLSLTMQSSLLVVRNKQTVLLNTRVSNAGGRAVSGVRIDVLFPNGSYLNADNQWVVIESPTLASYFVSSLAANASVTLPIQWRPVADGQVVAEIAASNVPDPDSTPNNRTSRAGEDDEANLFVRLR